jgi:hypothetical protein
MSIIALNVREIGQRGASEAFDSIKLCSYGKLLAQVAKARAEEGPEDEMTPDQLAERAEVLLAGIRKARR